MQFQAWMQHRNKGKKRTIAAGGGEQFGWDHSGGGLDSHFNLYNPATYATIGGARTA